MVTDEKQSSFGKRLNEAHAFLGFKNISLITQKLSQCEQALGINNQHICPKKRLRIIERELHRQALK